MTLEPESDLSVVVRAGKSFTVDPTAALLRELGEIVGDAKIRLVPAKPTAPQRRRRRSFSGTCSARSSCSGPLMR